MGMKLSIEGAVALMGHEGIVLSRYKDDVGVWTIGVGHTAAAGGVDPAKYFGKMSLNEVMDLFLNDVAKYENDVNKALKVKVKQHQFDALVSFHYNTGGIFKAAITKKLNAGDVAGAAKSFMGWLKPKSIKGRRTEEMILFRDGKYPAPYVNVYPASAAGRVLWKEGKRVDARGLLKDIYYKPTPVDPVVTPKPEPKPVDKSIEDAASVNPVWALIKSIFDAIKNWRK